MTQLHKVALSVAGALLAMSVSAAQLSDKKALNLAVAKELSAAAEAEAVKNKWNVVIAVVDEGGKLIHLQRMDGTQWGSIEVAIRKAESSIGFKRPTKAFEDAIAGGRMAVLAVTSVDVFPLEGGVPITTADGQIVGAIGVSGVTSQQDGQIAKAAIDAMPNIVK